MAAGDDSLALLTKLHHQALQILSAAVDRPIQGLQQGGRFLKLSTAWQRKLRDIDVCAAWARHITAQKVNAVVHDLQHVVDDGLRCKIIDQPIGNVDSDGIVKSAPFGEAVPIVAKPYIDHHIGHAEPDGIGVSEVVGGDAVPLETIEPVPDWIRKWQEKQAINDPIVAKSFIDQTNGIVGPDGTGVSAVVGEAVPIASIEPVPPRAEVVTSNPVPVKENEQRAFELINSGGFGVVSSKTPELAAIPEDPPSTVVGLLWNIHRFLTWACIQDPGHRGYSLPELDLFYEEYRLLYGHSCPLTRFLVVKKDDLLATFQRIPHIVSITELGD